MTNKPHFHVTAGLIWRDGKVLLTRRPPGSHLAGYWEFPGGKQEPGESLKACVEREIMEELGIHVQASDEVLTVDHDYGSKSISLHLLQCSLLQGEPQALGCDECRWVSPEDLEHYQLPPADIGMIPLIKKLKDASM